MTGASLPNMLGSPASSSKCVLLHSFTADSAMTVVLKDWGAQVRGLFTSLFSAFRAPQPNGLLS